MKAILIILIVVILIAITSYFILIGNIDKSEPKIVKLDKPIHIIGLEINTNDNVGVIHEA